MNSTIQRSFYLGNIFCKFDSTGNLDAFRIVRIDEDTKLATTKLDSNFHILDINNTNPYTVTELKDYIKKNGYQYLIPEGTITLSNIESFVTETGYHVNDVILMYFINGLIETEDNRDPDIYLRQSMDSLYYPGIVGVSNLKEEINNECYQISDLMYCNRLLGKSYVCNVYRTDTETEINYLLDNNRTQITLQDLYDHAGYMDIHSDVEFNVKNDETYNNGYCTNLKTLLDRSGFMDDIYSTMGMIHVDFAITEGENTITGDDKILVSLMFGGIRIINTYTTRFKYEEDLNEIKMKYFLVRDINDLVWIVGYTESEEEFPKELKAQQLEMLHTRLMECTKVYEESKK